MIKVTKHGILLKKIILDFESKGVLNPAVIEDGNIVHLFYRAVDNDHVSRIGHSLLSGPLTVTSRNERPVLVPEFDYESRGMEDPRISMVDGKYYLNTAFDGVNAMGALATSTDLSHFDKKGVIVPQIGFREFCRLTDFSDRLSCKYSRWNRHGERSAQNNKDALLWGKNLVFFPRKINGKLYFLHRIKPEIQIASVSELSQLNNSYWTDYFSDFSKHIVLSPRFAHESSYVGAGCPPIETEQGWILIYHGVEERNGSYIYSACVAMLDLKKPEIEMARLPYPLFSPDVSWEQHGEINNVCFPTGCLLSEDTLYIYYGAADEQIACASVTLSLLISELNQYKNEK
ncbi:pesticidal protein Cry7Aa [Rhizosphaericola mali]|uniref:Pesticidal protein Cry7Aa n=2 Tax=Rhizosphaericola mali TaxID=2545455 RepID=A0A5P2G5T6_9BACT|nr:pesticidal protein Cry7Aa [Rhizosphaericola mali]